MGIKHFFKWYKTNFSSTIIPINDEVKIEIDNLMIDLNAIFHNCAQYVYKYGNYKPQPSLLNPNRVQREATASPLVKRIEFFKLVCKNIDKLYNLVKPKKRLLLCIDGPAPLAKQAQQRQRRFKAAKDWKKSQNPSENSTATTTFNSNCISPGTEEMDYLSKYIDWYIRMKISEGVYADSFEIFFSGDKSPGEGEHKLIAYMRKYGIKGDESWCMFSPDADLIMLALASHFPKFYILREEGYARDRSYNLLNISDTTNGFDMQSQLIQKMKWWSDEECLPKQSMNLINDFITICFMVGNDFLPNVPSIEVLTNGIQVMFETYIESCRETSKFLTKTKDGKTTLVLKTLKVFLKSIGEKELEHFIEKAKNSSQYIYDPNLEECKTIQANSSLAFNLEKFKNNYYVNKVSTLVKGLPFSTENVSKISHEYFTGITWVINYYLHGTKDWKWRFPYNYAPFASDMWKYIDDYKYDRGECIFITPPFLQLMCILPPASADLLPTPLSTLLSDPSSPLKDYLPEKFVIDTEGKREEWEGIAILPFLDYDLFEKEYLRLGPKISERDLSRNRFFEGRTYTKTNVGIFFKSFYGDFISMCETKVTPL